MPAEFTSLKPAYCCMTTASVTEQMAESAQQAVVRDWESNVYNRVHWDMIIRSLCVRTRVISLEAAL